MSFGSRKETVTNLIEDKEYRFFYMQSHLKKSIPFQMRTMRSERNLSQIQAAEILGKAQNALSRLESPAYGRLTVQSLLDIAKGYDVGLVVKFVPYSRLLREYEDVSFEALSAPSPTAEFPAELEALNLWAAESDEGFWEKGNDTVELNYDLLIDATDYGIQFPSVRDQDRDEPLRPLMNWLDSRKGFSNQDLKLNNTVSATTAQESVGV